MAKFSRKRETMVEEQIKERGISNKRVLYAFLKIPRENFVREEDKGAAYNDSPLEIGFNQTISQPYIVALMSELLDPKDSDIILEIGTGSGYQAAILSEIAKEIISYEIVPQLCKFAEDNLEKAGIENVKVMCKDAAKIDSKECFDKVIVTASTSHIPKSWYESLKGDGVLVMPERESNGSETLVKYQKRRDKLEIIDKSIPVRFVPLRGDDGY